MKFELTETVAIANPEEVLRVLEQHLRAVAGDVVRTDGQITAYGIGPSPRTVNRRDTTVIDARELDGQTVLTVQVNYQASALLGNMPQDGIVRSKIEGAIDEMRGELKVWKPWAPPEPDAMGTRDIVQDAPPEAEPPATLQEQRKFETGGEEWPTVTAALSPELPEEALNTVSPAPSEEISETAVAGPVDLGIEAKDQPEVPSAIPEAATAGPYSQAQQREADTAKLVIPADDSAQRRAIVLSKGRRKKVRSHLDGEPEKQGPEQADQTTDVTQVVDSRPVAAPEVPLSSLLRGQGTEQAEDQKTSRWKILLIVTIVLLLALGVAGYLLRDQLPIPEPWKTAIAGWSSNMVEEAENLRAKVMGEKATAPAPVAAPVVDPVPAPLTSSDPEVMVKAESNIYLWVQDWAASLRSKDPVAQASYYADTVDRYLMQTNVSRDLVMQDKKAEIAERGDLWSVKVEHVYVENQNAAGARLHVVKRFLARDATGTTASHAVKVRLKLVRTGETWKIVEEQETGPAF